MTSDWADLADRAAALRDVPISKVSQPPSPASRAALDALTEAIVAEGVRRKVADMAVTRWLIERNADDSPKRIEDLVRETDEEMDTGAGR